MSEPEFDDDIAALDIGTKAKISLQKLRHADRELERGKRKSMLEWALMIALGIWGVYAITNAWPVFMTLWL